MSIPSELIKQADDLRNSNQGIKAVDKYAQAREQYREAGDLKAAAEAQHMLSVSLKIENDTEAALEAHEKAREMYAAIDDAVGVARVERDVAIVYNYAGDNDNALKHMALSVEQLRNQQGEVPDTQAELGISLIKMGHLKEKAGQLEQGMALAKEGLEHTMEANHWFYSATGCLHLAAMLHKAKNYKNALKEAAKSEALFLEHFSQEPHPRRLAQIYGQMAYTYMAMNQKQSAVNFHQKALDYLVGTDAAVAKVLEDIHHQELQRYTGLSR